MEMNKNNKRFSELSGKEIINIHDGARLGIISDCDLLIRDNGSIEYLLVPDFKSPMKLFGERKIIKIAWNDIKNVGNDLIVVEIDKYDYL